MQRTSKYIHRYILIFSILLSAILHWNIFKLDLIGVHLWRQSQNEWYVRNFLRNDNNILNPRIPAHNLGNPGNILRYEFPLMQWSIAQVKRLFGDYIFITRACMFIVGICCIIGFYFLIKTLFDAPLLASISSFTICFSPLFFYYMVNPMSDMCALCAQVWMMNYLFKYYRSESIKDFIWCCFFLMMAGLFKLPFYMFGIMPFTLIFIKLAKKEIPITVFLKLVSLLILFSLPVAVWYVYAISGWGYMGVIKGVTADINYSALLLYLKFALLNWFPLHIINPFCLLFFAIGIYLFAIMKYFDKYITGTLLSGVMITLLYYAYEINMIAKVHDYYMIPFLIWMHILIACGINFFWQKKQSFILLLFLAMPIFAFARISSYWSINRNGYKVDWFLNKKELQNAVPRDSLCIILNDNSGSVIPYVIDKQGYVFDKDDLPAMWVEDMILRRHARYMYSDSRKVDTSEEIKPFLEKMIMRRGEVRVFKLIDGERIDSE